MTFNASARRDPDGSIVKYQWDLDGNGSYETDTGTTQRPSRKTYATTQTIDVQLARHGQPRRQRTWTTQTLFVGNDAADGALHGHAEPGVIGQTGDLRRLRVERPRRHRSRSTNGTSTATARYETNTGTTPTTSQGLHDAGTVNVGLRVTDNGGKTATTTRR